MPDIITVYCVGHECPTYGNLCVDESARGQKIGEQLYDFAVNFAEENGCYNLTLHVWNDNEGALRFYEKRGMKAQSTTMEQIL